MTLENRVRDEIVALHDLLQAWFRGTGTKTPDAILARFDTDFTMIGAAGRLIRLPDFAALLPKVRGSRVGLLMEIHDVRVCHTSDNGVLALYREVQSADGSMNERWSSVLFVESGDNGLLWKHLQETFLPS